MSICEELRPQRFSELGNCMYVEARHLAALVSMLSTKGGLLPRKVDQYSLFMFRSDKY